MSTESIVPLTRNAHRLGILDPQDVQRNLPKFIEALMTADIGPSFTWPQFVANWHGRNGVIETRYEDLLTNASGELIRIVTGLTGSEPDPAWIEEIVRTYSFRAQSGRRQGDEKKGSFMRKGVAGDWANHFFRRSERDIRRFCRRGPHSTGV